jgi:transposase
MRVTKPGNWRSASLRTGRSAHPNRLSPWQYNRAMYKRRNEIERLFRRLKGFRRIFSRFEKLDVMFLGFLNFALIVDGLR